MWFKDKAEGKEMLWTSGEYYSIGKLIYYTQYLRTYTSTNSFYNIRQSALNV